MNDILPKVIYIAGYGRSGSTLLDILVGSHPDVEGVGELINIYSEWKKPSDELEEKDAFWTDVKNQYESLTANADTDLIAKSIFSIEWIGGIFFHIFKNKKSVTFNQYEKSQKALFTSISTISSKNIILDSSKTAWRTAWRPLALKSAGIDVRLVHLVRDGRGVMWSFLRGDNVKMERGDTDISMRFPVLRSTIGWVVANICVAAQSLFFPKGKVIKVRYEDLVNNPVVELGRMSKALGVDFTEVEESIKAGSDLQGGRQVSGNRLRKSGAVSIKADEEWKKKLPKRYRMVYWLIAAPVHWFIFSRSNKK